MQLVAENDDAAFAILYERHTNVAFSLAFRMCGKRQVAEEVVQEAFLSAWRSGARYDRTRGSVRTWVLGIVHNRAIDALRRGMVHDRGRVSDEGIEERLEAPERTDEEVGRRDEAREIRVALDESPRRAEPCDRARLLWRLQPQRDRDDARYTDRNHQGSYATRPTKAAIAARSHAGAVMSTTSENQCERGVDVGAYVARRARRARGRALPGASRDLRGVSRGALTATRGDRLAGDRRAPRPGAGRVAWAVDGSRARRG